MTIASAKTRHPYSYTLDLLDLAIKRLPPTFSDKQTGRYRERLEHFHKNPATGYPDIQATIAGLGKESWPYRKAYEEMYVRYGRSSEESFLLENLDKGIREKYERFIHEGGKISNIGVAKSIEELRQPSPFERFFTPEEKFAIEQALFKALEQARKEIDGLVLDKKRDEYAALVGSYKGRQQVIERKIDELRDLSRVSPKWETAILDEVRTIEEGWSVVERGVDEDQLGKLLEYWRGTLESFLNE
jgi:hypothetical protein